MIDDDEKPEFRTVRYHKHGTLTKSVNFKTSAECWTFETSGLINEYDGEGFDLITLLDDLSIDGFELVTGHDGKYILRTKEEIEVEQEYYSDDDTD